MKQQSHIQASFLVKAQSDSMQGTEILPVTLTGDNWDLQELHMSFAIDELLGH